MSKDIDGLDWLREIRKQIVSECDNDVKNLGEYYRNLQKQYETKMKTYSDFLDSNVSLAEVSQMEFDIYREEDLTKS